MVKLYCQKNYKQQVERKGKTEGEGKSNKETIKLKIIETTLIADANTKVKFLIKKE